MPVDTSNVNSMVLKLAGIDKTTEVQGVLKDKEGKPTGELISMATQYMIQKVAGMPFFNSLDSQGLRNFSKVARREGVTTATDLAARYDKNTLDAYYEVAADKKFPLRIEPAIRSQEMSNADGIEKIKSLKQTSSNKLFLVCVRSLQMVPSKDLQHVLNGLGITMATLKDLGIPLPKILKK